MRFKITHPLKLKNWRRSREVHADKPVPETAAPVPHHLKKKKKTLPLYTFLLLLKYYTLSILFIVYNYD